MIIDGNPVECEAMRLFLAQRPEEAKAIQAGFVREFNEARARGENYCPCKAACKHHGDCVVCVAVHRGHRNHLPFCMQGMLNDRIQALCELTEQSFTRREERT